WGLNHHPGVLIWNVYFIAQDLLLFAPARIWCGMRTARGQSPVGKSADEIVGHATSEKQSVSPIAASVAPPSPPTPLPRGERGDLEPEDARVTQRISWGCVAIEGVLVCVLLLPLLEPWGMCDHWPAWGLYASRAERTIVLIEASSRERLPP